MSCLLHNLSFGPAGYAPERDPYRDRAHISRELTNQFLHIHLCKSTPRPEASVALHGYKNCCMCGVRICFFEI